MCGEKSPGGVSDPVEEPDSQDPPGQTEAGGAAGQLVLGVAVAQWRGDPRPTPGLGPAHLLAGRTDQAPGVQPGVLIRPQADLAGNQRGQSRLWCGLTHLELLAGVVAGVGLVQDDDVEPAVLAVVVVAAGAPVLPLSHLVAAPLLPHLLGVVETPAAAAVTLQGEVTVLACKDSQSW